jgi:hypothetical protein
MKRIAVLATVLAFGLAGCGGDQDVVEKKNSSSSSSSDEESKMPAKDQGSLKESGFGQSDEYVGLAAIVKNNSDHAGQTVTVSFNLLDKDGNLLQTESQVDSFSWVDQELPVITQADVQPGQKVAKVEATLLIEDDGTFADTVSDDLGTADAQFAKGEYGETVAKVALTNPSDKILKNPAVRVVCRDAGGTISGSGYTFPELIGADGKYAEAVDVLASPGTKSCKAYLAPSALS